MTGLIFHFPTPKYPPFTVYVVGITGIHTATLLKIIIITSSLQIAITTAIYGSLFKIN